VVADTISVRVRIRVTINAGWESARGG